MTSLPKPPKRGPKEPQRIKRSRPIARSSKPIKRAKRPARLRKTPLAKLKRDLWEKIKLYVRSRDGNTCVSCGKGGLVGSGWHTGHLFPAGKYNIIRYEPKNVAPQCFNCNINLGGNGGAYAAWFLDRYGVDEFRRLSMLSKHIRKWERFEIEEMIVAIDKGGADYEMLYAEKYGLIPVTTDPPRPALIETSNPDRSET